MSWAKWCAVGITGTAAVVLMWASFHVPAQEQDAKANAAGPVARLPITRAVLFSSGVGFFERSGEVMGNARVDLAFRVEHINDLLKSMTVQDLDGGQVAAVTYDSHDPIEKTLRSFALDLTGNPTFAQLLNQARGERIELTLQLPDKPQETFSATIVGVEQQVQPVSERDGKVIVHDYLNVNTEQGLRSIRLSHVRQVRFLNPVLNRELTRALEVLAMSHDTQKKSVSLSFTGEGKRRVRIAYIVENPIWKTTYRLLVQKDGKLFLQGWAIVENVTDEDWSNVRVSLVSGRPISFWMDLYEPLYVPRPKVEPELFASLRPQAYQGALERELADKKEKGGPADRGAAEALALQARQAAQQAAQAPGMPPAPAGAARAPELGRRNLMQGGALAGQVRADKEADALALDEGIRSAATGSELGDFFQYVVDQPVTLPRQKSAMLPIINQPIEGKKVSIYNQRVHPKYPLLGLRLKNSSPLHLMQGPITVLEGNAYAGDARIQDLQPNEERLISYAVDLGVEIQPVAKSAPDHLTAVKIVKGVLHATFKLQHTHEYKIKNRDKDPRLVVIEHPFRADWKVVEPAKPSERARDVYRFEVTVPANQSAAYKVVEEKTQLTYLALTNLDDQSIRFYISQPAVSENVKKALQQTIELRYRVATTRQEIARVERQIQSIATDQNRVRENLKTVPQTSPLHARYLKRLEEQEATLDKLHGQLDELRQAEQTQQRELEDFLKNLDLE